MWVQAKTNWTKNDHFDAVDYNRIKNNIAHLKELSSTLYPAYTIADMGADKTYSDYYYADEVNTIENNFELINNKTLKQPYGEKKQYMDNGPTMDWEELNRLERSIQDLFDKLTNQFGSRRNLTFNFGKRGGI